MCVCVCVCVCVYVCANPKYTKIVMLSGDPQHVKPGKRKNQTSKEPHSDPRTGNNQPGLTNRACSVSSISARYAELEKPVPVRHPGNWVFSVSVVS